MKFGVILPHTKLFGGVKRFFELGNYFIQKGHSMVVFTPDAQQPDWFDFKGDIQKVSSIEQYSLDVLFFVEVAVLNHVLKANAKQKVFYHVIERAILKDVLKHKEITIFANSTNIYNFVKRKYGVESVKAFGAVDTKKYTPPEEKIERDTINIMAYGRISRKRKGTHLVVKACERLYKRNKNIKLILFDSPNNAEEEKEIEDFRCKVPFEFITNHPVIENKSLFQKADIFVSGEKRAGWSNTAAEAMASGVAVVATISGTMDFVLHEKTGIRVKRNSFSIGWGIKKLIRSEVMRQKYSKNGVQHIKKFDWEVLADSIIAHFTKL